MNDDDCTDSAATIHAAANRIVQQLRAIADPDVAMRLVVELGAILRDEPTAAGWLALATCAAHLIEESPVPRELGATTFGMLILQQSDKLAALQGAQ